MIDAALTAESERWLESLAAAGSPVSRPLTWRVADDGDRPGRLLPLWLEPEIDYERGVVHTARDSRRQLPSHGVRAHETAHWALAALGASTRRCLGLEGVCDVIAAILTGQPLIEAPIDGLTRDLRWPALRAKADLSTRAHLGRMLTALRASGVVSEAMLEAVERQHRRSANNDIHPHAFGIPFGAWTWGIVAPISAATALRCLVQAASAAQRTPAEAVEALVRVLPPASRVVAADRMEVWDELIKQVSAEDLRSP